MYVSLLDLSVISVRSADIVRRRLLEIRKRIGPKICAKSCCNQPKILHKSIFQLGMILPIKKGGKIGIVDVSLGLVLLPPAPAIPAYVDPGF